MASSFLDNLKKAVDTGEFNSEAAKKIIEIDKLADEKKNAFGLVSDRLEKAGYAESVSEEEAATINSKYEEQLEAVKKEEEENKRIADMTNAVQTQLSTLIEIEDMVKLSIVDMLEYIEDLEEKFGKEFKEENPIFGNLSLKMEEIQRKYNSIINN